MSTDRASSPTLPSIRISLIELQNRHDSEHVASVVLQQGTDLLFWNELQVKAGGGNEMQVDCVEEKRWEKPGQYYIRVRLDNQSSWSELRTAKQAQEHAYKDGDFMNVIIYISQSGEQTFRTYNENVDCGPPQ